MALDTGGLAFPSPERRAGEIGVAPAEYGMTLLDYFAAQVVAKCAEEFWGHEGAADDIAIASYQIATAMIKQKNRIEDKRENDEEDESDPVELSEGAKAAQRRPKDYDKLPAELKWEIDKELGILDWDGR